MSQYDVLIVEDDVAIARLMEIHLKRGGLSSLTIHNGEAAVEELKGSSFRLVILDRMLPGMRGMEILRWIRKNEATASLPVLMVTAIGDTDERVRGLEEGADDYLPKPFEPEELMARVKSLMRRAQLAPDPVGGGQGLEIDSEAMIARIGGEDIAIRPLEFRLLEALVRRKGKVCSREFLLDHVWGMDSEVEIRTVDVTVKRLRKELVKYDMADSIRTVRGAGYRFDEEEKG